MQIEAEETVLTTGKAKLQRVQPAVEASETTATSGDHDLTAGPNAHQDAKNINLLRIGTPNCLVVWKFDSCYSL